MKNGKQALRYIFLQKKQKGCRCNPSRGKPPHLSFLFYLATHVVSPKAEMTICFIYFSNKLKRAFEDNKLLCKLKIAKLF